MIPGQPTLAEIVTYTKQVHLFPHLNFCAMVNRILAAVLVIACLSCNKSSKNKMEQEAAAAGNNFSGVQFESNTDRVCLMSLSAGIADTAHYNNKIYGFCSKDCKTQFSQSPGSFVH